VNSAQSCYNGIVAITAGALPCQHPSQFCALKLGKPYFLMSAPWLEYCIAGFFYKVQIFAKFAN